MAELGEALSERELDVLQCLTRGASNREIALELDISHHTVKVHLRNIYAKLGVASRTEASTVAIQRGLILIPGTPSPATEPPVDMAPESIAALPAAAPGPPAPIAAAAPRSRRLLALVAVLVVVVGVLGWQLWRTTQPVMTPAATPERFVAEPVGETRWAISRSLPAPRARMALAAVGLQLYLIGGEGPDGVSGNVLVFQSDTGSWSQAAPKLTAVADITAAVLAGEIYVPGGRQADGRPTPSVEVYSPARDAWRTVADLPQPIAGGLAISDGSFVYLFGGANGNQTLNTAYLFDPAGASWRELPPMQQPRAFAAGGVAAGQIYVVGGADGSTELDRCERYDPAANSWSDCPALDQPRAGAGAVSLLNKLYIFGGGLETAVGGGELYSPASQVWEPVPVPVLTGSARWPYLGVSHIETSIYLVGGMRDGQLIADSYVYTPLAYQFFIPAASSAGGEP